MIRINITPDANGKWTVNESDGVNGRILLSSTSQGYDRFSRADGIARRIAPRGDEPVELVVRDADGKIKSREMLWTVDDAGRFVATQGLLRSREKSDA